MVGPTDDARHEEGSAVEETPGEIVAEESLGEQEGVPGAGGGEEAVEPAEWGPAEDMLRSLDEQLSGISARLEEMESALSDIARQQGLMPQKLRQIGQQVDDVSSSLGAPRVRDMLQSLLLLHDLIESMHAQTPCEDETNRKNYEVLLGQVLQMLEVNGLKMIDTEGEFDPNLHRPVAAVPCVSEEEAGRIVEVVRRGFRSDRGVLRYAEVAVTEHDPAAEASGEGAETGDEE